MSKMGRSPALVPLTTPTIAQSEKSLKNPRNDLIPINHATLAGETAHGSPCDEDITATGFS